MKIIVCKMQYMYIHVHLLKFGIYAIETAEI